MNKELETQLKTILRKTRGATFSDLEEVVVTFLSVVKELKSSLEKKADESMSKVEEHKGQYSKDKEYMDKCMSDMEEMIKEIDKTCKDYSSTETSTIYNKIKLEMQDLKDTIPNMPDLSQIDERILQISKRLEDIDSEEDDECEKLEENFNDTINELRDELYSKLESFKKDLSSRNVTGRPIFGRTNIKVLDNGTVVSDVVTELNFTNATSISVSGGTSRRVDIETGGSGSSTGAATPIAPTSGAINSSNRAYVFATEPKVIVANGVAIRQGYGFTWNSGTSTATLDNAPSTGTDVFGYSPVTETGRDPGVLTVSDATSITPSTALYRIVHQTNTQSAGTLTINADSDTPSDGRAFTLRIDSTNIQTFSWNSQYVGGTIALPTATSGSGKVDYYSFIYYATDSKYHFIGSALNLG